MAEPILRPRYFEGQVLGAADLEAGLAYTRGRQARHDRLAHSWGIVEGLALTSTPATSDAGDAYVTATLGAGVAVDGNGREIVVAADQVLSHELFVQLNVHTSGAPPETWYPVFLVGLDEPASEQRAFLGACAPAGESSRIREGFELSFGRPGDERGLEDQSVIDLADEGTAAAADRRWRVLVGYVQWAPAVAGGRFAAVTDEHDGIGRRYAGVRADEVAARGNGLVFRNGDAGEAGSPVVQIETTDEGGELSFGLDNGSGSVTKLFTVNAKGDVGAKGKLTGALATGTIQMESGEIFDGATPPLPSTVTQKQIDDGDAVVHIQLVPRPSGRFPPNEPAGSTRVWVSFPLLCELDADGRVSSVVRWQYLSGGTAPANETVDWPASCHYTLFAVVKPEKER